MKLLRLLALSALLGLCVAAPASAQYIWMDTNGDGVWSTADLLNPNGTPTTVDFWINTAHDRGHTGVDTVACDTGDGSLAVWNSFALHVNVLNGTATFTNPVNQQPTFTIGCADLNTIFKTDNSTQFSACAATGAPTPNGGVNLKMCTVTVTGASGSPSLAYVPQNSLDQNFTSFGTPCTGNDFDNTYKLGPLPGGGGPGDFTDNNGIGPAPGGNAPPTLNAPATATGTENQAFTVSATATDADAADILTMTATGQPADLSFASTPGVSPVTGTISGTLGFNDQGAHTITWSVNDGHNSPVTATTTLNVTDVDRAPVVTAPATESVAAGSPLQFTVTAADPDGDPIITFGGSPLPTGSAFTTNASHTSGTFDWTPTGAQAGTYDVTFTAANALSGSATTHITVTGGGADNPPAVTAPATMTGSENNLLTFTVTATDPDGQAITSLTAAPLPSGATFTANGTNTSGTFSWTPSFTQAGNYSVTFTASNALTGTATTAITIANTDRQPVVTAPASESGTEGTLLTFTVTASDPDGDAIASLTASALPAGATFTSDAAHTSGTFSWTPSAGQAGSYNVTFTAANALSGSATTQITITAQGADQPPVVTAPATETGTEGALLSFTVSASDVSASNPDGQAITSLTAAPLPSGATFTSNAAHTSGTFSWMPSAGQAGTYDVTFTASNALSGSATTHITISAQTVNHAPVVTAPATETVDEGQLLTFSVTATDADGDHVTLSATGVPSGATFTDNGDNTGTFTWTPNFSQSGTYTVTFTGNDGHGGTGTATTVITVNNVNTGGGGTATAKLVGNFNSHRRYLCFHVTPTNGSFDIHNVDLATVTLNFGGSSITALSSQSHIEADCDSEGTEECEDCGGDTGTRHIESLRAAAQCDTMLHVCFLMSDVVGLFGSQSIPDNLANATITGSLTTGGTFTATIEAPRLAERDASGDTQLHSRAKPNPLNPKTDLTFTLAQPGLVRVSVFDAQGRLVKNLLNETRPAGENVVAWDGSDAKGGHVASGVFFFRVEALGHRDIVRVTVLK